MWFSWRQKHLKPTWGNFIFNILVPGIFILYFLINEHSFVQNFRNQFEIMLTGEYMFLLMHMTFVYYVLPIMWFFEFFIFAKVSIPGIKIQRDLFVLLSNSMFIILTIVTLMILLVETT